MTRMTLKPLIGDKHKYFWPVVGMAGAILMTIERRWKGPIPVRRAAGGTDPALFVPGSPTIWFVVAIGVMATLAPASANAIFGPQQEQANLAALVGQWQASIGRSASTLTFDAQRRFDFDGVKGTFGFQSGNLVMQTDAPPVTYQYQLTGNQLQISGGDLTSPLIFTRKLERQYLYEIFDVSPRSLWLKSYRILFVLAVVVAVRLAIWLLRSLSWLVIFSERGPLAWFYRDYKNRTRTIHSLVLNIVKYFIYFTALGMVLSELGINYAAYLASLSIVGLAIGFGSQGLVQDMVTGFFIVLEGQFDVGDMVEISGQTGYVTEIGLRMTKIRNYLGQVVVIPNRNIGVAGNYARGAQRTYIDIAVGGVDPGRAMVAQLQEIGRQFARQFEGVVIEPVKATGPLSLTTGEHFVRLHLSIWPGQAWLVNDQLMPRLREILKAKGFEIPADRIVAFYHPREKIPLQACRPRLFWRRTSEDKQAGGAPPC